MRPVVAESWLLGGAVAFAVWLTGWTLLRLVVRLLPRFLHRSRTMVDDVFFASVRVHIPIWCLVLGLDIGSRYMPLTEVSRLWLDRVVVTVLVLSISIAAASFLTRLLTMRAAPGLERVPANTLIQTVIRVGVLSLGVLFILGNLGVSITPILTALGVGSLAVALALQPTLSNLFAGFHITLARLVRVGDYVELDNGQRGYVVDIGWRSTVIRELADNTLIVPNGRLAEMIVKNYSLPATSYGTAVDVTLPSGVDLERAQQVAAEAAREMQRTHPGAEPGAAASAMYREWQPSGIRLSSFLRVRDIRDQGAVTSDLIKMLDRRFREAGIEVILPQRVVHLNPPAPPAAPPAAPRSPGPTPPARGNPETQA